MLDEGTLTFNSEADVSKVLEQLADLDLVLTFQYAGNAILYI